MCTHQVNSTHLLNLRVEDDDDDDEHEEEDDDGDNVLTCSSSSALSSVTADLPSTAEDAASVFCKPNTFSYNIS